MKPLTLDDILSLDAFNAARRDHEREVIQHKSLRRVPLGESMTLLFENRVTLRWQIHEMCRVEGIVRPDAIQHELDTYNALLPAPDSLSATLLIEIPDPAERARQTRALVGLHEHLRLEIDGEDASLAQFDAEQFSAERISTVQFIRFPLTAAQREALHDLRRPARFVCDHPAYSATAPLAGAPRGALVEDLGE